MKTKLRKRSLLESLKGHLISIVFFAVIFGLFMGGVASAEKNSAAEERKVLEESLNKAIVSCYALEGFYPESVEYIEENYGLTYDKDKYSIGYIAFASNFYPEVDIIELGTVDDSANSDDAEAIIIE